MDFVLPLPALNGLPLSISGSARRLPSILLHWFFMLLQRYRTCYSSWRELADSNFNMSEALKYTRKPFLVLADSDTTVKL